MQIFLCFKIYLLTITQKVMLKLKKNVLKFYKLIFFCEISNAIMIYHTNKDSVGNSKIYYETYVLIYLPKIKSENNVKISKFSYKNNIYGQVVMILLCKKWNKRFCNTFVCIGIRGFHAINALEAIFIPLMSHCIIAVN